MRALAWTRSGIGQPAERRLGPEAAVDHQVLAGHERRLVGRQPRSGGSDLLWQPEPADAVGCEVHLQRPRVLHHPLHRGVWIVPGQIALTRMPSGAWSVDSARVRLITAALLAA